MRERGGIIQVPRLGVRTRMNERKRRNVWMANFIFFAAHRLWKEAEKEDDDAREPKEKVSVKKKKETRNTRNKDRETRRRRGSR